MATLQEKIESVVELMDSTPREAIARLRAVIAGTIQPEINRLAALAGEPPMNLAQTLLAALVPDRGIAHEQAFEQLASLVTDKWGDDASVVESADDWKIVIAKKP